MFNTQIFLLLISVLTSLSMSAQKSPLSESISTPECEAWVDSVFNTLSTHEKVGQLFVQNTPPTQDAQHKATVKTLVVQDQVGGMFFSKGSVDEFASMTNYAQSLAKVPLMMCIDGEWGVAMRVGGTPVFPYNISLGAIQDPTLLYRFGQAVAKECRDLGIQVDFAPVLDVNSNPNNPVIGYRSFGEDPQHVALLGRAFSLGMESEGVMAVAKHFPGHGDTNVDTHKALATINHSRQVLDDVDLVPFKQFIDADCGGIMVGHLNVPALDPSGRPASMSKKITTDLLQKELGFEGLIFTDGLNMQGAVAGGENISVAAFLAGADILLSPKNVATDIKAVEQAVNSGKIPKAELDRRVKKILAYKYALGLNHPSKVNLNGLSARLNSPENKALIQDLADASVTAVRNDASLLPIGNLANAKIAVVNIGADGNVFDQLCAKYATIDVYSSKAATFTAATVGEIKKHDIVIVAVYNDDQASRNAFAQLKDVRGLVPVFLTNPYKVAKFSQALTSVKTLVMTCGDSEPLRRAAAMGIFGGINVDGRLPVNVAGVANYGEGVTYYKSRLGFASPAAVGMKADVIQRVDSAMNAALKNGAFPGAQVVVVKDGDVIIDKCYGVTTKGGTAVTPSTVFDLASMSKAVGTVPGIMKVYDLGLVDLDQPASLIIPGLDVDGKRDLTPRMLLHHETGLPATLNMFTYMIDPDSYSGRLFTNKRDAAHTLPVPGGGFGATSSKLRKDITSSTKSSKFDIEAAKGVYVGQHTYDSIMSAIYNIDVKPTRKYLYSCLNFCLLMDLEQRLTGLPHQEWVTDNVWAPIGATSLTYNPREKYPLSQIAATENDGFLRRQHVQGYVHDELAAFSGGVQGNAGVFGNALDVAKLCQTWLNHGRYGDVQVFGEETTRLFTTEKSDNSRRGLGFDKPDMINKDSSPTVPEASAATYGHTGFTGTCFWVDPESDLIFVFLSNRVDPSRKNSAWSQSNIRSTLMTILYQSIE